MHARMIILVLFFAAVMPSVTPAATVDHYSSSGVNGFATFTISDNCANGQGIVSFSESTIKANGQATPSPVATVYIDLFDSCGMTPRFWYPLSMSNVTFTYTPANPNRLPHSISGSADIVLTDAYTGDTKTIHVQINLVSAGNISESRTSIHRVYPSSNGKSIKVDEDSRGQESSATGTLTVSGGFQYIAASQYGTVGVSTSRSFTITH